MDSPSPVLDRLLEVSVLLRQDLARTLEDTGLTTARARLLQELHRLGPSTQRCLAVVLAVSSSSVSTLIDALETGGFVRRDPHPTDHRASLVSLTPQGSHALPVIQGVYAQLAHHLFQDLDPQQLDQLGLGLDHVLDRLRARGEGSVSSSSPLTGFSSHGDPLPQRPR